MGYSSHGILQSVCGHQGNPCVFSRKDDRLVCEFMRATDYVQGTEGWMEKGWVHASAHCHGCMSLHFTSHADLCRVLARLLLLCARIQTIC